jgi:ATP-dependent 26S proteasome regulatory subunit
MVPKWFVMLSHWLAKKPLLLFSYVFFPSSLSCLIHFLLFCLSQIDELDAIGTKRFDSDKSGDREVQRTMLELLNQLDGFSSDDRIKVIAATNRPDILDPALLRSGRLDRKVEFPLPDEDGRAKILRIHSNKMTRSDGS